MKAQSWDSFKIAKLKLAQFLSIILKRLRKENLCV